MLHFRPSCLNSHIAIHDLRLNLMTSEPMVAKFTNSLLRNGVQNSLNLTFSTRFSLRGNWGGSLFRYVDSVKELTKILVANVGILLDLGSNQRNLRDINST
jgi:hypothetical protein